MKAMSEAIERLPSVTPANMAYRYQIGFAPRNTGEWWSDFHVKEIAIEKHYALSYAKTLQKILDHGVENLPELDAKKGWRVCIVDLKQPNKIFSET